jgi:hypothetical protein
MQLKMAHVLKKINGDRKVLIEQGAINKDHPELVSLKISRDSRYLVDYNEKKIFILNAIAEFSEFIVADFHIQLEYLTDDKTGLLSITNWRCLPPFKEPKKSKPHIIINQSLLYIKNCLFSIYGTVDYQGSSDIYYIDTTDYGAHNWIQLKIKHNKKTTFPRYNVTSCGLETKSAIYLTVSGGETIPVLAPGDQNFDMYNFIEVYIISNTSLKGTTEAELITLDKNKLVGASHLPFIPYLFSYAYEFEKKLYILGGYGTERSIFDWAFHTFEITANSKPEDWEITDVKVFINTLVTNYQPEKEELKKHDNLDDLIAVADKNRNFIFDNAEVNFFYRNGDLFYHTIYFKNDKVRTKIYRDLPSAVD